MYKIAAVGDFEVASCLGIIGADVFFARTYSGAEKIIGRLIKGGSYAVIFVSEKFFAEKMNTGILPSVVPLPCGENGAYDESTVV